jgi:hypothetical protein
MTDTQMLMHLEEVNKVASEYIKGNDETTIYYLMNGVE